VDDGRSLLASIVFLSIWIANEMRIHPARGAIALWFGWDERFV
jgi:hypothetical protein